MLDISKLQYVLFDWDNTLVESRSSLTSAIEKVLQEYKLPCWEEIKVRRQKDLSFKDNFPYLFGSQANEAYQRYREVYLQIMPKQIAVFPYVVETLQFFQHLGIPMYIVSNKERILLEKEQQLLLPKIHFRKIVCGHEASADKPNPEQILYALKDDISPEQISPEIAWMIGDSPMDSEASIKANVQSIRIGHSIWGDEGKEDSNIVYFNNFKDFYRQIGKID